MKLYVECWDLQKIGHNYWVIQTPLACIMLVQSNDGEYGVLIKGSWMKIQG